MTSAELKTRALKAEGDGTMLTLVIPKPYPQRFPRGDLLCDTGNGRLYMVDPLKLLIWCRKNPDPK